MGSFQISKSFIIILILLTNFICFSAEVYDYDYFSKTDNEGMHYILKISNFYDLLWNSDSPALKKYSLNQHNNDMRAIDEYNFENIEVNGYLVTKFNEAKQKGLFELFNQAFNAKNQTPFDIYEDRPEGYKLVCSLGIVRYLYAYKVLKSAEQKEWDLVIEDLHRWLHTMVMISEYQPFRGPVIVTMFALLQKYDLPINTIKEIIAMNELVISNPPKEREEDIQAPRQGVINLCILNITVANLLLYEKENSALPDNLSQLRYLDPLLTRQTREISYKKDGLNWTLYYKSQVINKGKLVRPISEVISGMI